ncbi:MAG TPA: ankyrin repeat domain-containing protein [Tepidisphaeraceae bacterium]|nr:ankyrin repeat domain-containing protein [Tepidisphaeraceae bacterium]
MKEQKPMTLERLLSRSYGKESTSFWRGGPRGLTLEDVRRYLDQGGDVNGRFESGDTLLHNAASNLQMDIVRLLVARGADVNAKGAHGYSALHHAVDMECNTQSREDYSRATELPLTQVLIEAGADETLRDDDNETARDYVVAYGEPETRLYDSLPRQQSRKDEAPAA